jgi:hypothetical protein
MPRTRLGIFVTLAVAFLVSGTATGQTPSYTHLRGLKAVRVWVEGLAPADASCGLTESIIDTAAAKTLLDSGIVVKRDAVTTLYVAVTTVYLQAGRLCASDVSIHLVELSRPAVPSYWEGNVPALVTLILDSSGITLASGPSEHADHVRAAIRTYTEEIAIHILGANQK